MIEIKLPFETDLAIGSIVSLGHHDWRVLDKQDGKALLLADRILEYREYNTYREIVPWMNCTLRQYLNGDFYNSFDRNEKSRILETELSNPDNPLYGVAGGDDTTDKIFLLSLEETIRYFGDSGQLRRMRRKNQYFIKDQYNQQRIAVDKDGKSYWWWLRTPGDEAGCAVRIFTDGDIRVCGYHVNESGGVRPALWLRHSNDFNDRFY